jgi:hypothetical protein
VYTYINIWPMPTASKVNLKEKHTVSHLKRLPHRVQAVVDHLSAVHMQRLPVLGHMGHGKELEVGVGLVRLPQVYVLVRQLYPLSKET